ncbi:MAG TPA: DinB family protein [Patescibacteria group bacterium]|nr:DinB family protein [Patescibacteria group bacterium]
MKRLLGIAVICLAAALGVRAQSAPVNPVSSHLRHVLNFFANNLIATAQEFPADKYTYHPTPAQMTVGETMRHIAQVNNFACSKVAGVPTPELAKVSLTDKEKLVEGLKSSMDFCQQAFAKLDDSKLGDSVPWFGGQHTTRFGAAMEVTNDLIDHYATLATYLRLNGMLPPTAQHNKK